MPLRLLPSASQSKAALSILAIACALAANAEAGSRAAPVVYKGDSVSTAAPVRPAQAPSTPGARLAPVDRSTARIEFRYPNSQPAEASVVTASVPSLPTYAPGRPSALVEAPQIVAPARPVVEAASLQAMPEPAGQGMAYTPLKPVAEATAPVGANSEFTEAGRAIVYGDEFAGLPTANGEIFSQTELTAAHPSLPLPSLVRVTNTQTGREVVVRVNDRGPFEDGASIQLSRKAAEALGMNGAGAGDVSLSYLSPAPVLSTQPAAQPVVQAPAASAPPSAKFSGPVSAAAQTVAWPVAQEDELLGGGNTQAAPRLMSMTVAPKAAYSPAPAMAAGDTYVQLASFSDIGNAEAMLRRVESQFAVEIVPARVNGADFFRVRVGPFQDHGAAEQARQRLYADGTADGRIVTGR